MNNPVSRLDMIRALVAYARSHIMPTSEQGEEILRLALNHYYDDMSYNELDLRYSALQLLLERDFYEAKAEALYR